MPHFQQTMKKNSCHLQEKLQYRLYLSLCLLVSRQWFSRGRKHLPEGDLRKCVGVFGCLSGWVGLLSGLRGGKGRDARQAERLRMVFSTQNSLSSALRDCWVPAVCAGVGNMFGMIEANTELYFTHKVFAAHFQMHKLF